MANAHLASLAIKHARLESLITQEAQRPVPDSVAIAKLKKQKLRVKEAISGTD